MGDMSKDPKNPSPACAWMRGRWRWSQSCRNVEKIHLRLAFGREGGGGGGRCLGRAEKNHLLLAFGHKGGGGGGRRVETDKKKPPPARIWIRGRRRWWQVRRNRRKNHLRLAFGCKGGGGCGGCAEAETKITSDSHLDAREAAVVVDTSKPRKKKTPSTRIWMRGRWWHWQCGVTDVSSGLRKKEWEKTGNDESRCPFS